MYTTSDRVELALILASGVIGLAAIFATFFH
jgi:hypothetical protein